MKEKEKEKENDLQFKWIMVKIKQIKLFLNMIVYFKFGENVSN